VRRLPAIAALALAAALATGLVPALTGCTGRADRAPEPGPTWHESTLPLPAGPAGRVAVREATHCAGSWWVVGGVFLDQPLGDQDTRPAVWRSDDGRVWASVPVEARTFWGQRAILTSVACAQGTVAIVGARAGGAHGNPRVTTFYADGDRLRDVEAPFSQYGGEQATNVGPITGGPKGWLITGNRSSGPAVWTSATGREFALHEATPGLADDDALHALAQDAAWDADAGQWVVVGGGSAPGHTLDREPTAWTSPDGATWSREQVPGTTDLDDLERVVATPGGVVALGLRGSTFGAWERLRGTWRQRTSFGEIPSDASHVSFVASLVSDGAHLWATASDGVRYGLWRGTDATSWAAVRLPASAPATAGEHTLSVAAGEGVVLLLSDNGHGGRVWVSRVAD
jgi:hypothetical protein